MANPKITGTVGAVSRAGKAFTVNGQGKPDGTGDIWFSCRIPAQQFGVVQGALVEFQYKINPGTKGDFYNVQGNVNVLNPGAGAQVLPYSSINPQSGKLPGQSPVMPKVGAVPLERERCIVRQNASTGAATLMQNCVFSESTTAMELAEVHRSVAQYIEEWTSGDLDNKEAKAALLKEQLANGRDTASPVTAEALYDQASNA